MMTTVGIIGGLGTETSCSFCFNVNHKVKRNHKVQPHLIMDNIPMSDKMFQKIANGEHSKDVFKLLQDSVIRLNKADSDFIVIPCNTVHVSIEQLRKISSIPILSIIEETAKKCKDNSFQKVGVLGSTTTTKSGLYQKELNKQRIECINLDETEQEIVTNIILKILSIKSDDKDKKKLLDIIQNMKQRGAEAVILGCSDLFLLVKGEESVLPVINSTGTLEEAVVKMLAS